MRRPDESLRCDAIFSLRVGLASVNAHLNCRWSTSFSQFAGLMASGAPGWWSVVRGTPRIMIGALHVVLRSAAAIPRGASAALLLRVLLTVVTAWRLRIVLLTAAAAMLSFRLQLVQTGKVKDA